MDENSGAPRRFQVDLRGIIDLLANHLYSSPRVFVRELLQNAVDAIRARRALSPDHRGQIEIEVEPGRDDGPPTLVCRDDGIGLTEEEVHGFLSTIGASSKRDAIDDLRRDFIGQFGIGLLSCFLVAENVVMVTRSAATGGRPLRWTGRADGTYAVHALDGDLEPGTTVYLRARPEHAEWFKPETVERLVRSYGGLLPVPIRMRLPDRERLLDQSGAPWRHDHHGPHEKDLAIRSLCRSRFRFEPMDWIPLRSAAGDVDGVAFVLDKPVSLAARTTHCVYLKNMLLTEDARDILPPWAFFVRCIVNVNDLRPTASREALYEDERLAAARRTLGRGLKRYLFRLARENAPRLQRLLAVHHVSMKALALEDDEFFRVVVNWLPFETSAGLMTLAEYLERSRDVLYTKTSDQFRQLAAIASALSLVLINAGHDNDREFLEKLAQLDTDVRVRPVDPVSFLGRFEEPDAAYADRLADFLAGAQAALSVYGCAVDLKSFPPEELPALYCLTEEQGFERSVAVARDRADGLWSSMLDRLREASERARTRAVLCLNAANPLVRRLVGVRSPKLRALAAEVLYLQALLLGQHPLRPEELAALTRGLRRLLEIGIDAEET